MKKQFIQLLFLSMFITHTFCSEPTLPYIENPTNPEEHIENFLWHLQNELTLYLKNLPAGDDDPVRKMTTLQMFIEKSIWHIYGIDSHEKKHGHLHYLFFPPSDKTRMQSLETQLQKWIQAHKKHHFSINKIEKALQNKKEIITYLHTNLPHLLTTADKDDLPTYGIQWPCTIL
jgi:hypothetical protein